MWSQEQENNERNLTLTKFGLHLMWLFKFVEETIYLFVHDYEKVSWSF
jgi:hypothetical protein